MFGEGDVFDGPALVVRKDSVCHCVESLGAASSAIEDAADLRMLKQPKIDRNCVLHMDEVTRLLARTITGVAFKEPYRIAALQLIVEMEGDACHRSLVLLAGAVDIEVAQTCNRTLEILQVPAEVLIKQEF